MEEREAHVYAGGVRRGGVLVTVRTDDSRAAEARAILARHDPVDLASREADYRAGGCRGYDEGCLSSSTPDGTPDYPPGTELSRGIDQVARTNISGARPENE